MHASGQSLCVLQTFETEEYQVHPNRKINFKSADFGNNLTPFLMTSIEDLKLKETKSENGNKFQTYLLVLVLALASSCLFSVLSCEVMIN